MIDWNKPIETRISNSAEVLKVLNGGQRAVILFSGESGLQHVGIYSNNNFYFRNTPAPPKLVPYDYDDFPRGVVYIRMREQPGNLYLVCVIDSCGVLYANGASDTWEELFEDNEMSTDLGKTWLPCGVMEVQP